MTPSQHVFLPPAAWKRSFPGRRARRPAPAGTPLETCHLPSRTCSWSGCRSGRRWHRTEPGTPPEKQKGRVTALCDNAHVSVTWQHSWLSCGYNCPARRGCLPSPLSCSYLLLLIRSFADADAFVFQPRATRHARQKRWGRKCPRLSKKPASDLASSF